MVDTEDGWVLLDTGMSRAALDSADNQAAYAAAAESGGADPTPVRGHLRPEPPDPARWNWGLAGDPMVAALATVDLAPADLVLAAVSHLHLDHSGGVPTLARAGVPVALHRHELEFARSGAVGLADGFHAPDFSDPATTWQLLDEDTEIAPGVTALTTPGHTPGHLSFRVDLPRTGSWIFTADATDLAQNLLDRVTCGSCAGGTAADEEAADASLDKLLTVAAQTHGRLIPGHDQIVTAAIAHPPGGHR
nr:MBL fold metallo-hydrolase [Nakamurella flavida]